MPITRRVRIGAVYFIGFVAIPFIGYQYETSDGLEFAAWLAAGIILAIVGLHQMLKSIQLISRRSTSS